MSISSLAMPTAVERSLPGVWLTPLLNNEDVRQALQTSTAPTLAVGGTGDPTWDSEFVPELQNIKVVAIDGPTTHSNTQAIPPDQSNRSRSSRSGLVPSSASSGRTRFPSKRAWSSLGDRQHRDHQAPQVDLACVAPPMRNSNVLATSTPMITEPSGVR